MLVLRQQDGLFVNSESIHSFVRHGGSLQGANEPTHTLVLVARVTARLSCGEGETANGVTRWLGTQLQSCGAGQEQSCYSSYCFTLIRNFFL